jgi:hypothetical protein
MNLAIAALEASYFKSPQLLIHALGGGSCSVLTTHLAQRFFEPLRITPGARATEDQIYILFLLSLMGYDFGRAFSDYGYQAFFSVLQEHQLRTRLITHLQALATEQSVPDFVIEHSIASTFNPLLWLKPNLEKINFSWRGKNDYFHHAACTVNTESVQDKNLLSCDLTISPPQLHK